VARWPPPVYRIRTDLDAPIDFAFRWCTDYASNDGKLAGEPYERRIIERTPDRVVLEDLWWAPDGWKWRRSDVHLAPPDRWHSDSVGNIRDASIDYRLTSLPGGRTRLLIVMHRRPGSVRPVQPPRAELEEEIGRMWGRLAASLAREYRRSTARTRSPRPDARRAR
jgi:hypothetical protein